MGDLLLFLSGLLMIIVSFIITIKTRFVQFRKIPTMFKLLFARQSVGKQTIHARSALFTAMSTTLGISTIVAPVIAIKIGGPGVVLGFLLASFLGAAINFTEVSFAVSYRSVERDHVKGGPMSYLEKAFSPLLAKWYALGGFVLMMVWSAAQANQLGAMLDSPLLGSYGIPKWATGLFLSLFVTIILIGGIKRIASFSAKLVPVMFLLYVGASLWIIALNIGKLPAIFEVIWSSCWAPQSFGTGAMIGGVVSSFRWGIMKGIHGNEAGIGTQTIPHSMAETQTPVDQGVLAMASTYSAGFILILSSLVALITETWLDPTLPLGIDMVATSFKNYFSYFGIFIVAASAILFSFGTILGNSFNGSQCFLYLTQYRKVNIFYVGSALLVFLGTMMNVTTLWATADYFLALILVPHVIALLILSFRKNALQISTV
ncbi:MAG: alanine/glycine:cation symporter family protein [Chlamydiales bacterium]